MKESVRKIKNTVVDRFEEIHVGTRVIKSPELRAAETAIELHAALSAVLWRCNAEMPQLLSILHFRREVRIEGELSFDGKPITEKRNN